MEQALDQVLQSHQGSGRGQYDALVLFSGGKDSAYLLHRLTTHYPSLRLLAATIDNGFFNPVAMKNAAKILQRIDGVDHMVFKPDASLYRTTFRHALTHLDDGGCYATVDRMDGDLAFDIGRNLAASLGIPLMIAGLSPTQVERIFGLRWFETDRSVERSKRTRSAGFRLEDIYATRELAYWWDGTAWPDDRIPRVLYPFCAWPYREEEVRDEVVRLGLIDPGQDNPLVTNNDTIPVMFAVDSCQLGYSSFEPEFADLVREGKADRNGWLNLFQSLEYLAARGQFLPRGIDQTLRQIGLTHQEVGLPALLTDDWPLEAAANAASLA
jgi:hypothetical protein